MSYVSEGRTVAVPRKHFLEDALRAFEMRLDSPIVEVAHPACEPERRGFDEYAVPKSDPLHQAFYESVQSSCDVDVPIGAVTVIRT